MASQSIRFYFRRRFDLLRSHSLYCFVFFVRIILKIENNFDHISGSDFSCVWTENEGFSEINLVFEPLHERESEHMSQLVVHAK